MYSVSSSGQQELPDLIFEEQDGVMTGMHFSVHAQGDETVKDNTREMFLSILAFAGAQKGNGLLFNQKEKILNSFPESPLEGFHYSFYGVNIDCDIEYSGYFNTYIGTLLPFDNVESYYSLTFSMEKEGP